MGKPPGVSTIDMGPRRRSSAERESAAEKHRAELAEATRRADARCAGMAQEHARELQDAARQAEAQLQRLTQTHELEQVRSTSIQQVAATERCSG